MEHPAASLSLFDVGRFFRAKVCGKRFLTHNRQLFLRRAYIGVIWRVVCRADCCISNQEKSSSIADIRRSICGIVDVRWLPHGVIHWMGFVRMREPDSMAPNTGRDSGPRSVRCPYCVEGREFKLMLNRDSD
jgi:hypothetical protein